MHKSLLKRAGKWFLVAMFSCLMTAPVAFVYALPPAPIGYINDYADILTPSQESQLEEQLVAFEKTSTIQVAVVIVKNLSGDYIENYAAELFADWGIGDKEKDNGILFLVAIEERQMRFEVGYGLEGAFTDAQAGAIIRNDITPLFKQGNYFGGIEKGLLGVIQATRGEYKDETVPFEEPNLGPLTHIPTIGFFGFMAIQLLVAVLGRSKSWWLGGVLGAGGGGTLMYFNPFELPMLFGILITIFLTVCGLVFDYAVSATYAHRSANGGSGSSWRSGGGWGSSSSGRSSSSGSSGRSSFGGGSSGGGGASGRW